MAEPKDAESDSSSDDQMDRSQVELNYLHSKVDTRA